MWYTTRSLSWIWDFPTSCSWHLFWAHARSNDLSTIVFINSNLFEGYRPQQLTKLKAPAEGFKQPVKVNLWYFVATCFLDSSQRIIWSSSWWFIHFIPSFVSSRSSFVVPSLQYSCAHPAKVSAYESKSLLFCRNIVSLIQASGSFVVHDDDLFIVFRHFVPRVVVPCAASCRFHPPQKGRDSLPDRQTDRQKSRFLAVAIHLPT